MITYFMKLGEIIVTREYLISLLKAWGDDKITTVDLYSTMSQLDGGEVLDWEIEGSTKWGREGDYSASSEVLDVFDSLDVNLITKDDINAYIEYLHTPVGECIKGDKKLQIYKSTIDYNAREQQLKYIEPYTRIYGQSSSYSLIVDNVIVTREYLISLFKNWKNENITAR